MDWGMRLEPGNAPVCEHPFPAAADSRSRHRPRHSLRKRLYERLPEWQEIFVCGSEVRMQSYNQARADKKQADNDSTSPRTGKVAHSHPVAEPIRWLNLARCGSGAGQLRSHYEQYSQPVFQHYSPS